MIGLTRKEATCLAFIQAFHAREGIMPTRREMVAGLHYKSTAAVARLVDALVERGSLRRIPKRPRALALVKQTRCPTCGHLFEPSIASLPGPASPGEARGRRAPQSNAARATSSARNGPHG